MSASISKSLDGSSLAPESLPESAGDRRIVSDFSETLGDAEETGGATTLGPRTEGTRTERWFTGVLG
ncbi:MAG: hypothetical protein VXA76_00770 [Actinomycetota bacterium]